MTLLFWSLVSLANSWPICLHSPPDGLRFSPRAAPCNDAPHTRPATNAKAPPICAARSVGRVQALDADGFLNANQQEKQAQDCGSERPVKSEAARLYVIPTIIFLREEIHDLSIAQDLNWRSVPAAVLIEYCIIPTNLFAIENQKDFPVW